MARLTAFALSVCVVSIAMGEVSTTVYLADGRTALESADPNAPFVYRDIMVGTKLTIIVGSDANGSWSGALQIEGIDRDYGTVSARDYSELTSLWEGSILEDAGSVARVRPFENFSHTGAYMNASTSAIAGDWFVIDYVATNVGNCNVGFYEVNVPPCPNCDDSNPPLPEEVLLYELVFSHVPTRDFNGDTNVDFVDFAVIAAFQGTTNCADLNGCEGADLDSDGDVDADDLMMFVDFWLERTDQPFVEEQDSAIVVPDGA